MTLKELSQLYFLRCEIARDEARLEELRDLVGNISSPRLDGMPRSSRVSDPVAAAAQDIVDLEALIGLKRQEMIHERARLERYIYDIDDSLTRLIFSYRFIDGLDWRTVAAEVGGGNTEASVKMICYRYIHAHE